MFYWDYYLGSLLLNLGLFEGESRKLVSLHLLLLLLIHGAARLGLYLQCGPISHNLGLLILEGVTLPVVHWLEGLLRQFLVSLGTEVLLGVQLLGQSRKVLLTLGVDDLVSASVLGGAEDVLMLCHYCVGFHYHMLLLSLGLTHCLAQYLWFDNLVFII